MKGNNIPAFIYHRVFSFEEICPCIKEANQVKSPVNEPKARRDGVLLMAISIIIMAETIGIYIYILGLELELIPEAQDSFVNKSSVFFFEELLPLLFTFIESVLSVSVKLLG